MSQPPGSGRERRRTSAEYQANLHREAKAQDAAAQREVRIRKRHRRRWIARGLLVAAVLVAVSHALEHADAFRLLSPGWQDILIGYPTAGVLAVVGLMLLPAEKY